MAKPSTSKAQPKKRSDRRGTPKGKGVRAGNGGGGKIGNPPFEATAEQREQVCEWAAAGVTQATMAAKLGISEDTLARHFRKELDDGLAVANAELGSVLYKKAKDGDIRAIEQWFDRRGGPEWKKKTALEHTGANGGPIEYRDLTEEELDARIEARLGEDATAGATKH
jgi:AraC-like DNA-binding protein